MACVEKKYTWCILEEKNTIGQMVSMKKQGNRHNLRWNGDLEHETSLIVIQGKISAWWSVMSKWLKTG